MGIKLDLGAGTTPFRRRPGYEFYADSVTMDVFQFGDIDIVADIGKEIPLETGSVSHIRCVEVLEHIPYARTERLVSEIYRVLEKGGNMILQCPNFATTSVAWLSKETPEEERLYAFHCIVGGQAECCPNFGDTHKNIFTPDTLRAMFAKHPFASIVLPPVQDVPYPQSGWNWKYHIQLEVVK